MNYSMNAGMLYQESSKVPVARMKCSLLGPKRKIYLQDDLPALQTDILTQNETEQPGNVRNRCYLLTDSEDNTVAQAKPGYAGGENPSETGWPICRLPKVDHADVIIQGRIWILVMYSSHRYDLQDEKGPPILHVTHRGISGGWLLEDNFGFTPDVLCGIFIFCRYLEQEHEFLIV